MFIDSAVKLNKKRDLLGSLYIAFIEAHNEKMGDMAFLEKLRLKRSIINAQGYIKLPIVWE